MESFVIPLLLAAAGAAVGAYFAIVRTKRERLWTERYEKLSSALSKVNLIHRFLDSEINGEHQIHGLTKHEKDSLDANWPKARYDLATDITMLQMLFVQSDFKKAHKLWDALEKELFSLIEDSSSYDAHEYVARARAMASKLQSTLIELSRSKCL